jgi:NADH-quinone oxidoreductase subunit G
MPKFTLDGETLEVAPGTTILQAAMSRGREIPHYCYHPALSIAGNCRMCLVEVEKAPKLLIGCSTQITDGMVVHTETERVKKARAAMMEFFLINHPLDCPICDQAGECRLQEYAVEHGTGVSRYVEPKVTANKAVDIGPHVLLDQERCIQCSRCIRFCDEISKTGELAFFRRGERTVIGVYPDRPLDNAYSGNVVDICPVGALTLKEFRFQTRVWYLKNTPTICAGCARGCNVFVGTGQKQVMMTSSGQLDDSIKRIVPRVNEEVNGHWICDEGRLSYQRLYAAPRLDRARVAGADASWDDAVSRAAELLKQAAGAGRVAAILSPRLVCEDLFAWREMFGKLGGAKTAVRRIVRGQDDDLLIRADKGANATGARWVLGGGPSEEDVMGAARRGEADVLFVAGDALDPGEVPALDGLPSSVQVVYVGPFAAGPAEGAAVALPSITWSEGDGTYVNFQERIQQVRRCHVPKGTMRPGWRIAADVAAAAEVDLPGWTSADEVLASLAAAVKQFEGLDAETVGLLGVPGGVAGARV